MACPDESVLVAFLAHSLAPEASSQVADHLDACEICRASVAAFVKLNDGGPPASPPPPPKSIGPFTVVGLIGRGGMGDVYRARDPRLGRDVAIKVMARGMRDNAEWLARFEREARTVARIAHPNIVAIYEVGRHDGAPYLVSELLEGQTLRAILLDGPIPPRRALDWALQIARGLAAVHERGVVHRDLKPENLFVTRDGSVKILDFGLAKPGGEGAPPDDADPDAPAERPTEPGVIMGTAGYMAPEQLLGESIDARTDIFSFGAVLQEMLSGEPAFARASKWDSLVALLSAQRRPLQVPEYPGAEIIVDRCVERQPAGRFQSARDIVFTLEALVAGRSWSSAPAPRAPARPRRRARLGTLILAGCLASAAAAAGVTVSLRPRAGPARASSVPAWRRLTYGRGPITAARFATGDAFVFDRFTGHHEVNSFFGRLEGHGAREIVQDAGLLALSRAGELAVTSEATYIGDVVSAIGVLTRVALTGGAPRRVLEHVAGADWSPDGRLATLQVEGGRFRLSFPIDRPLLDLGVAISHVRVSPTSDMVAFLEHPYEHDDRGFVAYLDAKGEKHRLTGELSSVSGLAWSPAGDEIWFTGTPLGSVRELRSVSLDGTQRVRLRPPIKITLQDIDAGGRVLLAQEIKQRRIRSRDARTGQELDISPFEMATLSDLSDDGKTALLLEQTDPTLSDYRIYLAPTDGSTPVFLGAGSNGTLSPDGRWVLVTSFERPDELKLIPTGTGLPRIIARGGLGVRALADWFPDGRRIVFAGGESGKALRIYVGDLDGREERAVSPEGVSPALFDPVSPDGEWIAGVPSAGGLVLYPVAGGEPRAVKGLQPDDDLVRWAADGKALIVKDGQDPPVRVVRIDLATGQRTQVQELRPTAREGLVQIRSLASSAAGDVYVYDMKVSSSDLFVVTGL